MNFTPSGMTNLRDSLRDGWNDLPLLLAPSVLFCIGCVFLLGVGTFRTDEAFSLMRFILPIQEAWGSIFVVVATATIASYVYGWRAFKHTSIALFALYQFIAISFLISSGVVATGTFSYTGLALLSLWGPFHAGSRSR